MEHSPAGPLIHEHRIIERVIAVLTAHAEAIEEQGVPDPELLDRAVDFMHTFADRCHHGKEEHILFRRLADKDLDPPLRETMEGLIREHAVGRTLVTVLSEGTARFREGDKQASADLLETIRSLVELYPAHIEKEERHFFKPAVAHFTHEERGEMLREFDELEKDLLHEKYLALVEQMEASSRVPAGASPPSV